MVLIKAVKRSCVFWVFVFHSRLAFTITQNLQQEKDEAGVEMKVDFRDSINRTTPYADDYYNAIFQTIID